MPRAQQAGTDGCMGRAMSARGKAPQCRCAQRAPVTLQRPRSAAWQAAAAASLAPPLVQLRIALS